MPWANYGVLKGRPVQRRLPRASTPHDQFHLIADKLKNTRHLAGALALGAVLVVRLDGRAHLGNQGGIITLLDAAGPKAHGAVDTRRQAAREGRTIAR